MNARRKILLLFPFILFLLCLGPRLVAVGRYVTPDEAIWVYRSIQFREALLDGRWADTLVAGHPGVTTTWLGAVGMTIQLWVAEGARAAYEWLTTMAYLTPDNVEAYKRLAVLLTGGRVAVAVANSLGIVAIYLLVRRLWGGKVAVVAGLLLAFDPFLAGLSGLLHVDGLSATFATLSLLTLLVGQQPGNLAGLGKRTWIWMALAGGLAGLAVLSKSPTLLLLPITGAVLLWPLFSDHRLPLRRRFGMFLRDGVVWTAALLITILVLFPAIWAIPMDVVATVGGSANRHLGEALRETFFLGETAFDHGPLFYPVVVLWRLSPVFWLALIPVAFWLRSRYRSGQKWPHTTFSVLVLVAWAVLYLLAITPAAKKFDRYILPVVPALLLLAALAWSRWATRRPRAGRWVIALVIVGQLAYWLAFAAYPLTAYNPLVGGPRTAVRVLPVGWGEGISVAGGELSRTQTNVEQKRALSGVVPSLAPFFKGRTLVDGLDDPATADYVIVTLGGLQLDPDGLQARTQELNLIETVHFGGLDQAWVYEQKPARLPDVPPNLPEPVTFGDRISLVSYSQAAEEDVVELSAVWERLGPVAADERYTLRIVIIDESSNVWAAHETDLLDEVYFYPFDWVDETSGIVRYRLELPPGIPRSAYDVTLSLIDNRTSGQLPVRIGDGLYQGVVYEAGEIVVPPSETVVSAARMRIPNAGGTKWLDDRLQLLGVGEIAAEALAGSLLPVDLFWHLPQNALPAGLSVAWHLVTPEGDERLISAGALSRYDTGMWRTGESIQEKYLVPLPPDLPRGRYTLSLAPLQSNGVSLEPTIPLAEIQVNNIDRLYELPDEVPFPMDVRWEPMNLLGMGPDLLTGIPGETVDLTLYWEKRESHGDVYSVFVHVLDEAGNIVLQADHWPGGLPTDILDSGQVVIDQVPLSLPADLPPGNYDIRVGLYSADSGLRLPIVGDQADSGVDFVTLPLPLQVTIP